MLSYPVRETPKHRQGRTPCQAAPLRSDAAKVADSMVFVGSGDETPKPHISLHPA
jgi:hypothetical protein